MTQMLLFDFPTPVTSPVPVTSRSAARGQCPEVRSGFHSGRSDRGAGPLEAVGTAEAASGGSLPLYDPAQGELHRIGDLAQLVLARYEIVHRRRAARLRRAQATPSMT